MIVVTFLIGYKKCRFILFYLISFSALTQADLILVDDLIYACGQTSFIVKALASSINNSTITVFGFGGFQDIFPHTRLAKVTCGTTVI